MCVFVNILKLKPHQVYIKGLTEINLQKKDTHTQKNDSHTHTIVYRLTMAIPSMKIRCERKMYIYLTDRTKEKAKIESALCSRIPLEAHTESSDVEITYGEDRLREWKREREKATTTTTRKKAEALNMVREKNHCTPNVHTKNKP